MILSIGISKSSPAMASSEISSKLDSVQNQYESTAQTLLYSSQILALNINELTDQYLSPAPISVYYTQYYPGAIQRCPVQGPINFTDTFGDYRSGGRTHQGTDLIANYNTPVVAVHDGTAVKSWNSLGGNSVLVYHNDGDYTYYAHLSSYGKSGKVRAGEIIGYVGSTGDTSTNHLHFEYHPNGGNAINPYNILLQVC